MINKEKIDTSLFFLEYLANEDEEFIDSNDHEFLGENENGYSGVCTLKITDMAADAVEIIKYLTAQRDDLLAALKETNTLIIVAVCRRPHTKAVIDRNIELIAKCEAQS